MWNTTYVNKVERNWRMQMASVADPHKHTNIPHTHTHTHTNANRPHTPLIYTPTLVKSREWCWQSQGNSFTFISLLTIIKSLNIHMQLNCLGDIADHTQNYCIFFFFAIWDHPATGFIVAHRSMLVYHSDITNTGFELLFIRHQMPQSKESWTLIFSLLSPPCLV